MKKNVFSIIWVIFSIMLLNSCSSKEIKLPEVGVCTNLSNGEFLKQNGYSFIEESVGHFLMPTKNEKEFNEMLQQAQNAALPVKTCNSFIPKELKSVGPDAMHTQILEFAETTFRRAQKAGVGIIVFGSGGSRAIPEGFSHEKARDQFIELCKKMASIAQKNNITIVLEPLNTTECNFINSVMEGGEIVKKVNHPNFRLLADIYHMRMENEGPESIIQFGKLIKHVHIAEKKDRAAPGTYDEDFSPYFDALKKTGYKGKISIEARWQDFDTQIPVAIKTIEKQFNN
jgi:sugar phosphate isomerase/epimerase